MPLLRKYDDKRAGIRNYDFECKGYCICLSEVTTVAMVMAGFPKAEGMDFPTAVGRD